MHLASMTRRGFLRASALVGGGAALGVPLWRGEPTALRDLRTAAPPLFGAPASEYYGQTGFWVRDQTSIPSDPGKTARFFMEFRRFGGINTLGYPASRPYWQGGFLYQIFQRGVLQWRLDKATPQAVPANVMDQLHDLGKDPDLERLYSIPSHFAGDDGSGGDLAKAREIRLAWLTDPAIAAAYRRSPGPLGPMLNQWDPVEFYGLPTSQPVRRGPFTVQRFQRYALQKWEEDVPGMPPRGSVVGVLVGDIAKTAGLAPTSAIAPEENQGNSAAPISQNEIAARGLYAFNEVRRLHSLPLLEYSPYLEQAGLIRVDQMIAAGGISHYGPDGRPALEGVLSGLGRSNFSWGEVLALFSNRYDIIENIVAGWMGSPGHHDVLVQPRFRQVAIAGKLAPDGLSFYCIGLFADRV